MDGGLKKIKKIIIMYRQIYLSQIEKLINKKFIGEDCLIQGVNFCDRKTNYNSIISYVTSKKYLNIFKENTNIRALFLSEDLLEVYQEVRECAFYVVDNPELSFYDLHELFIKDTDFYKSKENSIVLSTSIHPSVVIEEGVRIGEHVKIGANSVIKSGTIIKDNVKIGANSVVGGEGFQIIYYDNVPHTIEHVGGVLIEENVFIGDCCSITKSLFEGTVVIKKNTKIDSQVHIGHNCEIGENTVITGNSLLMGSVKIGDNVWIAPSSTISNKVTLEDNTFVGSFSLVNKNSSKGEKLMGSPALNFNDYMKLLIAQKKTILKKK